MKEPPAHYHGSIIDWKALSKQSRKRVRNKYARDTINMKRRVYYHNNSDAIKAYNKNNKEVIKTKRKAYHKKNNEAIKTKKKAYYQLNRDKKLEQQRNYRMKKANEFYELFGTYEIEPGMY